MVPVLLGIPFLSITALLQSSVISRISLGYGKADLVMLVIVCWALQERVSSHWYWAVFGGLLMSLISAAPFFSYLISYLLIVGICQVIKRNIWQIPIVTLVFCVILGSLIENGVSWMALYLSGISLPLMKSFTNIVLPSLFFNTLLGIPVYYGMSDFAQLVHPKKYDYE